MSDNRALWSAVCLLTQTVADLSTIVTSKAEGRDIIKYMRNLNSRLGQLNQMLEAREMTGPTELDERLEALEEREREREEDRQRPVIITLKKAQ